jgi:hypothetical protein
MGGILHAVAEFLKLNPRTAFALFAAGVGLWMLLHWGVVTHDVTELSVAYLASFGFFVWLYFRFESLTAAIPRWRQRRVAKREADAREAAAKAQAEAARAEALQRAEMARKTAVANLAHLSSAEIETVKWMHHKQRFRIRASQNWFEISNLVNLSVLLVENQDQPLSDRFFVMPQHIRDALQALFGPPREEVVARVPPWTTRSRGLN